MDYTTNYQLPVWAETDRILMDDFNDMTEKIEEALSELPEKGNCQIYITSYLGSGTFGYNSQNSLTFPGLPLAVMVVGTTECIMLAFHSCSHAWSYIDAVDYMNIGWSGNTLSWYDMNSARNQLNQSSRTYHVIAFLNAAE